MIYENDRRATSSKGRQRFPIGTESAGLERTLESRGYQRAEFIAPSARMGEVEPLWLSVRPCRSRLAKLRTRRLSPVCPPSTPSPPPPRPSLEEEVDRTASSILFQGMHPAGPVSIICAVLLTPFVLKTRATIQVRDPLRLFYAALPLPRPLPPLPVFSPEARNIRH